MPYHSRRSATLTLALLLIGLLTLLSGYVAAHPLSNPEAGRPDRAVLLPPGPSDIPSVGPLAGADAGYGYVSALTATPRPFTHLLLRWEGAVPPEAGLELELRVSADGQQWSPWGAAGEDADLWQPGDGEQVHWSQIIAAGFEARFWQVRARFVPAPDGALPALRWIEVNTVDARFGPSAPAPEAPHAATVAQAGRPPVVSRTAWGNPDGQGSRVPPAYFPGRHMIVHHTADSNSLSGSQQSWADRVRAIWSFHTFTRGWGDIGYNYLIDPNGVIYEGRAGGDDAVGFHDTGNYGSMGVALIGIYNTTAPSNAMLESLVNLLAWKAEQKGVDPLGRSYYYGCAISRYCSPFNPGAAINHIAGHRSVTPGHTTCPGDRVDALLPTIRQRVRERLSGAARDNGDLTVDDRERGFERSNANWYQWPCGYDGNTSYSFGTDTPTESANRGVWRPNLPEAGRYHVLVYIPQGCGLPRATARATYRIAAADRTYEVTINQETAEEWVSLGTYRFAAGHQGYVELSDLTGEALIRQRVVYFDAIRWIKEEPTAARVDLLNVRYDRVSLAAGELLKVTFTIRNSGTAPVESQAPEAERSADGRFNLNEGYVYDESECFLGAPGQAYPTYPKEFGRIRLTLGPIEAERQPQCAGDSGGYPWRWGINGRLAPGETREVVGYLRLRTVGSFQLRAGLINEYVAYFARDVAVTPLSVTPERQPPAPVAYDHLLRPLAYVYREGGTPANFLARSGEGSALARGAFLGSFVWQGMPNDDLEAALGGSVGATERLILEQTRIFVAPEAGDYTFQVSSNDHAWLWIDGQLVLSATGQQDETTVERTLHLGAGRHVLAFRSLERGGRRTAGYAVRRPGQARSGLPVEGLAGSGSTVTERLGSTFQQFDGLMLAADDLGGSGVARLLVSVNDGPWEEYAGPIASLGSLPDGQYRVHYVAVDQAGNRSEEQTLSFRVDSRLEVRRVHMPFALRPWPFRRS
ncbi:MAG: golvesin C-terminal-like domain-containing protein [Chloroflexaceae bacterium]